MASIHAAIAAQNLAVITGGASGIGLAAAKALYKKGMNVAIGDKCDNLNDAVKKVQEDSPSQKSNKVWADSVDVGDVASLEMFSKKVQEAFPKSDLTVLMANAGVSGATKASEWQGWQRVLNANMFGVINTVQVFLPLIKSHQSSALIINTGSKQGITTPPGSGAAYNVSKAAVKVFTEQLAHELRSEEATKCIEPKLLIPGWVFTGLSGANTPGKTKPEGAWSAEQTVEFMLESIQKGSFYILAPDNDTPREVDLKRMKWNVQDIIEDRPALSRWHADYSSKFDEFMKKSEL
ncbi:hypothetical protein CBS101457_000572 [Exobasidium rhododendri]|nr:hypothetical protein CBS101457_000572 [Exobasidium rhododendri]